MISFVEIMTDRSGTYALSVMGESGHRHILCSDPRDVASHLNLACQVSDCTVFTPDCRPFFDLGVSPPLGLIDLRVAYGQKRLIRRSLENTTSVLVPRLRSLQKLIRAEQRAREVARVDPEKVSFFQGLGSVLGEWLGDRAELLTELGRWTPGHVLTTCAQRIDVLRALHRIERSGVHHANGSTRMFELDPYVGKTGRFRSIGFDCMGIPHGEPRKRIVSRHVGGKICSFDFNAIDYRCIVASVDDPKFRELYRDTSDFHLRTCQLLRGYPDDPWTRTGTLPDEQQRRIVKQSTYTSVYGGQPSTLAKQIGVDEERARRFMVRLAEVLAPVHRLRESLYAQVQLTGKVCLPNGRVIEIDLDAHAGKVIGLYAQSYSSWVFERALVWIDQNIDRIAPRSMPIFPVHDELVFDMHPDELGTVDELARGMTSPAWAVPGMDLVVKAKMGDNYDETA